ncbi:ATP-dependent RNA helicase HrpA [Polyangium spumosum]|uniref:ATP-dependent RNA helicase HrpA n=1 Tax=Polyangium spumosum TaxID=889282 RepID=A0A6N7PUT4_9BACT|nr:ATP-dependent RNA helicase HrpA [Polyangium spumosum]
MSQESVSFPEELPISARVRDIAQAMYDHQVVIIAGETGSGKTTQLPKIALAMGRGLKARIGVTQPRRIAATSVAARVAKELGVDLGKEVGYKIRFADRTSPSTYVRFMTDGILLAEIQGDPLLRAYDTLIVDEAHERTLNIDFLLGYLKRILPRRKDLRVVVSSATLETERFSAFFDGAPVIQVSGRTHPVETIYRPARKEETELAETIANTIEEITELDPREDILVFLPGEREIHEVMDELHSHGLPHTVVLPLYGRLPQSEQQRVFSPLPQRRVVLATNVAETSLTIPGIVYVIDAGLARVNRYHARSGVTALQIEPISRASAEQRKGRAGRIRSGVCFRLYEERDFELRPAYTDPEVLRVGLAGAILQMKSLGIGDIRDFSFLDPPPRRAVDEGYRVLEEIGAIDDAGELTDIGKKLARLPLDPRLGRMVLGGEQEGALRDVLVVASALGIQDPRERPLAAQKQADEAHRRFRDEASDFAGLVKLWHAYKQAEARLSKNQLRKWCRDNFLSHLRMREWSDVHQQISQIVREMGFRVEATQGDGGDGVHRAIVPALLSKIGMWSAEAKAYVGARQTRFQLHPSSGLARKAPAWIMAAELVETSQLFARTASRVDPAWLEEFGGSLCRKHHSDPHWEEKPAQVMAREQISLYGLPIVRDRKIHYGPIDPAASRTIFITHALVRQEYATKARFMEHNRKLFEEVKRLRDKARKSDMLADDHALSLFFEERIPEGVYSGKTFEAWRKEAEAKDPHLLELSLADVLQGEADELTPERFPDTLSLYGTRLPLTYRFDPGEDDDGVTISLPLALLPQAEPAVLEWTIPGWHAEKIEWLLDAMPKAVRKSVGAIKELSAELARRHRPFEGPMLESLARSIQERTGARVPMDALRPDELPPFLRFYFRVLDEDGRVVGEGRDLAALKERFAKRARDAWAGASKATLEREGLTSWNFETLPEEVRIEVAGRKLAGYPALVDTEMSVALRVLASREAADEATRGGLRRLILLQMSMPMNKMEHQVSAAVATGALAERAGAGGTPLRRQIVLRALDDAFGLNDPLRFPRTRKDFLARLDKGKVDLAASISRLGKLAQEIGAELARAEQSLRALAGKPGAPRASLQEIRVQLDHLIPPGMFLRERVERLAHLPRYLRAVQIRLERMPNGPQKDQSKAEQVAPFWKNYLDHHEGLRGRGVPAEDLDTFRWLIEELRVSLFAPELKTAVTVSPQRLGEFWRVLSG